MRTLCIVGGSLAGLSTARALRNQGFDGRLVLVGDEQHRPYDRPPLSKDFLAGKVDVADLSLECEDEDLGLDWRLGVRAIGLDSSSRAVLLDNGDVVLADGLVVATGATARTLATGHGLDGLHVLRTLDHALSLRDDLVGRPSLVVVGGGFIGSEIASTARTLGLEVTLVTGGREPLRGQLGSFASVVKELHAEHGVRVESGAKVTGFTGGGRVDGVVLDDGRRLPADTVALGIGAVPNTDFLLGSGVEVDDGVVCGMNGSTSIPGVVAVGDCAAWFDPFVGHYARVEHWTGARERAAIAATTLLSGGTAPLPRLRAPYFWSDLYDVRLQFAGHTELADSVAVESGSVDERSFLAVYRREGVAVAALAMNHTKPFTAIRRTLVSGREAARQSLQGASA
jgi:NADPH-dependent 2,4-dienoyl-CoA reductase/sulfur reductase-like enzyme